MSVRFRRNKKLVVVRYVQVDQKLTFANLINAGRADYFTLNTLHRCFARDARKKSLVIVLTNSHIASIASLDEGQPRGRIIL